MFTSTNATRFYHSKLPYTMEGSSLAANIKAEQEVQLITMRTTIRAFSEYWLELLWLELKRQWAKKGSIF
jgi:hypothetical protein